MKNIKYIVGLAVISLLHPSCQKFVDYDPHEAYQITAADYLKSSDDYQKMVIGVYSPTQWLYQYHLIGDIASDNSVSGGESPSQDLALDQIDDFYGTTNNTLLTEVWKSCFEGINRANYLQENKAKLEFAGKDALYGEVYFLRAYYYFQLVRMFGDVPLFVERRLTVSDSKTLKRAPKADVYRQIELDLNNAITALPITNPQKGRITKYAAQALLGKVLLYQGDDAHKDKFTAAAAMLDNVINAPSFSGGLVPNFEDLFMQSGENGMESVYEVQYSNGSPFYDWSNPGRGQGNFAVQFCGVRNITGNSDYASGWSANLPTANLAAAFTAGDTRKDATILDIAAYKTAHLELNITYDVAPYKNTGLYSQKYQPKKGETSGQIELNYLNNFRAIRLAEVYLMAAEANNRATAPNDAKAQLYLNKVRRRAFAVADGSKDVTSTGTTLKIAIWAERRLELAMEGDRFFDLVRTGQAASKITGFVPGKNEVFPIPQQEVDISGLTQNPGYN